MTNARTAKALLKSHADPEKAKLLQRFFKTGPGEYGEGDVFIGVVVPNTHKVAKQCKDLPLEDVEQLICSSIHEERLLALFILRHQYPKNKTEIAKFYIKHLAHVNNWDLVDSSAHYILGDYYQDRSKIQLYKWAQSKDLWERRIAIISCFAFINKGEFTDALAISEVLVNDEHDLIHKAVGWMLREIGKKDQKVEERFLRKHYKSMPRTMLRYAIEKFEEPLRQKYLKGRI